MTNQVRTITYKVQMLTSEGKKEGRSFQTTLTGVGKTSEEVKAKLQSLGDKISKETGKNFKIGTDRTLGFKDGLKQLTREVSKAERNFETINREYKQMSANVKRTADEQEQLNAIFRLGKGATLSQKKEVVQLVKEYQKLRGATNVANKSMRNFRGQMNNVGFQLQDVVVQAQAGTSAFVIFSQQGSQLAASLGKNGPLIGAGVALAGVLGSLLFPALMDAGKGVEELKEKLNKLADESGISINQSRVLINQLNKENLERSKKLVSLRKENESNKKKIKDDQDIIDAVNKHNLALKQGLANRNSVFKSVTLEISKNKELRDSYNQNSVQMGLLSDEIKETTDRMFLLAQIAGSGKSIKAINDNKKANEDLIKTLSEQVQVLGLSELEILERNKKLALSKLAEQNATDAQKESVAAMHDQIIAYKEAADEISNYEDFLGKLESAEKERSKLLKELGDEDTLLGELKARYESEQQLLQGHNSALLKSTEKYERDKLKINGTAFEKYMVTLEDNVKNFDTLAISSLENFTQGFGQAVANSVFEAENLGDAMAGIFEAVGKNMIAFFAEWAAQELILWTLKQTLGVATQTSSATTQTANAQAMSLTAGLNAFAATAAIPYVGPVLAPAAMGAALAVTQPMAAAISGIAFAGAFDQGGTIPQDALGIVSEYRDELVNGVLIRGQQGGTRVTGSEETQTLLSGGNSGNMMFNINSSGNASPDQIANALVRKIKNGKGGKQLETALYMATERGRRNRGRR